MTPPPTRYHPVPTDDGTAWTGRIEWGEEIPGSLHDVMARSADTDDNRYATTEAADWLTGYLTSKGGQAPSADVKKAARAAGHSERALQRARDRL